MSNEMRPPIWVGHVAVHTPTLEATEEFFKTIGLRSVFRGEEVAVLELRGGTHLVVIDDPAALPGAVDFDLMVEDVDAAHARFQQLGLEVGALEPGNIHTSFTVTEPGGRTIVVNSSHVADHASV